MIKAGPGGAVAAPQRTPPAGYAVEIDGAAVRFRTKKRDVLALTEVTMRVEPGEFVAIVGPSGCGKSTLLKLASGLLTPSAGTVRLLGADVTAPRKDVGYVFQKAALLEWRTARKNILLQAEMRHMPAKVAAARADELIAMTGLRGFEDAYPHELSGGMQQRVALCRALLHRPPVLLMDEPFGALDALTREQMNVELRRIWQETATTVLLVTHSIAEAVYLADRVVMITARPGTVAGVVDVDLPLDRAYGATMSEPAFTDATRIIRDHLGASAAE